MNSSEASSPFSDHSGLCVQVLESQARGITVVDALNPENPIVYANPAFVGMTGYSLDEILGKNHRFLQKGDAEQEVLDRLRDALSRGESFDGVLRNYRKNGEVFYNRISIAPVFNEQKEITHYVGVHFDQTSDPVSNERIRASDERYRQIVEMSRDGIWEYNLETQESFFSDRMYTMLGYETHQHHAGLLFFREILHPDDHSQAEEVLDFLKDPLLNEFRVNVRFQAADGRWRTVLSRGRCVCRDSTGAPVKLAGIHTDVTDLVMVEEEQQRLALAVHQAHDSIVITDDQGSILYVNPAFERNTQYTVSEVMGRNPRILKSGLHTDPFYTEMWATLSSGNVWRGELINRRKDGSELIEDAVITPVRDPAGGIRNYIANKQEITKTKKAEDDLRRSEETLRSLWRHIQTVREDERKRVSREIHDDLGQFLSGINMDLTSMRTRLDGLDAESSRALIEQVREAEKLVDRAVTSVRRICADLRPGILDDLGLIPAVDWLVRDTESRYDLKVLLKRDDDLPGCSEAVATHLFRILQELIFNVAQHASAHVISLTMCLQGGTFLLEVEDDGVGISFPRRDDEGSFGLMGIRERVYIMNGEFLIVKTEKGGTRASVRIPLSTYEQE